MYAHFLLRRVGVRAFVLLAGLTVACSSPPPPVPAVSTKCGSVAACPAGTRCFRPPYGSTAQVCCRDSTCSELFLPRPDADPPRPPDAGAPEAAEPGDGAAMSGSDGAASPDVVAVAGLPEVAEPGPIAPADGAGPDDGSALDLLPPAPDLPPDGVPDPTPAEDPALAKGLKVYLRLDDAPPSQAFRDGSGNGNTATLHDADPTAASTEGRYDRGLKLAGGSGGGWLEMAAGPAFNDISGGISIAAWLLRTPQETADGTIVSRRSAGSAGQLFVLDVAGDQLRARLNSTSGYNANLTSGTSLPHGRWVHVAMTYDAHNVRLFVDGREQIAAPYALGLPGELTPVLVGAAEPGAGGPPVSRLAGTLDEVLLHNRALTDRELADLAARSRPAVK